MLNLKKWMAKVSEKLSGLRGLTVVADDYYAGNTSGQTHSYTLENGSCYLLFCGKINAAGSGVYFVTANAANTMVGALLNSSLVTVTPNGLTLSVKFDANYTRISLIKVGGVISYIIHLTELLKSFVGRRWARYVKPQESADGNRGYTWCRVHAGQFVFPRKRYNGNTASVFKNVHNRPHIPFDQLVSLQNNSNKYCCKCDDIYGSTLAYRWRNIHERGDSGFGYTCVSETVTPAPERGWLCA